MKTGVLTLATISEASPEAASDFQEKLSAAVQDCKQFRNDKPRDVTLKLRIVPHPNDPDDVIITPQVGSKTPARQHAPFRARGTARGQLHFDFQIEETN